MTTDPYESDPAVGAGRFMILGSARTGSNLLLSLLSAHPSIKTYGELFKLDALPSESIEEALDDPVTYLRRRVYRAHPPHVRTAGFKMFYYHLTPEYFEPPPDHFYALHHLRDRDGRVSAAVRMRDERPTLDTKFADTWHFLQRDKGLAVIHLKRRNMLETIVSLKVALKSNRWLSHDNPQPTMTVYVTPEECSRCFEALEAFAAEADRSFREHRKLDVDYEDLVENRDDTLSRLFTFLQVQSQAVSTRLRKQITRPASTIVENYDELSRHFKDTRWAMFFT